MGFEARLAGKERGDATDAKGLYDHKDKGGIEHGLTDRQGLKTAAKRLRTVSNTDVGVRVPPSAPFKSSTYVIS